MDLKVLSDGLPRKKKKKKSFLDARISSIKFKAYGNNFSKIIFLISDNSRISRFESLSLSLSLSDQDLEDFGSHGFSGGGIR